MKTAAQLLALIYCSFTALSQTCIQYEESNGLVIMEAENTTTDYTNFWALKTDVADYKGSGHLEFLQNETRGGSPRGPLSYTFQIHTEGSYRILLRARKRVSDGDSQDKSNDCYIRVEGDYTASAQASDDDYGLAKLEILQADTKIYGGNLDSWGKAFTLDLGGAQGKRVPFYNFKAEENYTFVMSGRSRQYNVDRIIFYKVGDYGLNEDDILLYNNTPETVCQHFLSNETYTNSADRDFQILRNPVSSNVLLIKKNSQTPLQIMSLEGKLLKTITSPEGDLAIDVTLWPTGVYLLRSEKSTARFLIQ